MQYFDNNKGQGLPINTIILIAVGLLILVLMIVFVTGGFKGLAPATTNNGLSTYQSECSTYCSEAQSTGQLPEQFCYNSPVVIAGTYYVCPNSTTTLGSLNPTPSCTVSLTNGTTLTWSYSKVPTYGHCSVS